MTRASPTGYAYFDTSALIKRYVDEPGRRAVLQLLRKNHCIVSAVLPVEIRSALRRRVTEGTIDKRRAPAILRRFTADRAFWTFMEVSREVLVAAESLTAARPLRALDAIHVASAQVFALRVAPPGFIFVSADVRQTTAAAAARLPTRHIES
jgi:predicted nucleic acid-binding protein